MNDLEFRKYHKELKRYSKNLISKNFFIYGEVVNTICKNDLINEAIVNGCYDIESAKKIIRTHLINENRILKGKRQYSGISAGYEKKCNKCGEIKLSYEFYEVSDKKANLTYLSYCCKDCNLIRNRDYRKLNPEKVKKMAKIRYERWKIKHKKYNYKELIKC